MCDFLTEVTAALLECNVDNKLAQVAALGTPVVITEAVPALRLTQAGRPARPGLVPPKEVGQRGLGTPIGRAALIHAIAHIEFNAVNLALDAVYRFRHMPLDYYVEWLQVAQEEAMHFGLLRAHLQGYGFDYGDFLAHNGLWEMAVKTDHDVLARMALVPRIMEARGLDVVPPIQARLRNSGDARASEILDVILRDEIGHVRIGNRWYHWCCAQRGVAPVPTFVSLMREHAAPAFKGELNASARIAAGFTAEEVELIASLRL